MKQKTNAFDFAITSYCQARCRSCMRTDEQTGETVNWLTPEHMKIEDFEKVLQGSSLITNTLERLEFCGELGDPMMHPDIDKFLEVGFKYANEIIIDTNGGLRQPAWYDRAVQLYGRKLHINWGIDGVDHDTNWKYREGVNFERALDNMTMWFEQGGRGQWHFLIFDWNWHQIPDAIQLAKSIPNCELMFKMNGRQFGKISDDNKKIALKLLEEADVV